MSRGDRGKLDTTIRIVFALVFAILSAGLIWTLSAEHTQAAKARSYAEEYAEGSENRIAKTCVDRVVPAAFAECATEVVKADRENARKEQDLVAQQTTAVWTFVMGCTAIIGMAISVVGVLLVWTTFRETKAANRIAMKASARASRQASASAADTARALKFAEDNAKAVRDQVEVAREIAHNQLRPYVHVCEEIISIPYIVGRVSDVATAKIFFKNFGLLPARKVQMWVKAEIAPYIKGSLDRTLPKKPMAVYADMPSNMVHWFAPIKVTGLKSAHEQLRAGVMAIYVWGKIKYLDEQGNPQTTSFSFASRAEGYDDQLLLTDWEWNSAT